MKLSYTPKALADLQNIKEQISSTLGEEVAAKILRKITATIRHLEIYPMAGVKLSNIIDVQTDYCYLFVIKNYVFYRIEQKEIKIIRILNERQDYLQILFGISSDSGTGDW